MNQTKQKVKRTPHKQLRLIRKALGLTQMQAATMLGVSYPYLLSIETGQRELSRTVADRARKAFGAVRIGNKDEEPFIRDATGKEVPFTKNEFRRYVSSLPSFWLDEDFSGPEGPHRITPTFSDYARCAHALLIAAQREGTLGLVLADFFSWFVQSIRSDSMYEHLGKSFDELFPGQRAKSDAYLALTIRWGLDLENELFQNQHRKARAAARAARKRRRAGSVQRKRLRSNVRPRVK